MSAIAPQPVQSMTQRYAKCITASKRLRWDIDVDVIRGRRLDFDRKFMPDGLSRLEALAFLGPAQVRLASQIQGRTYANMIGMVERAIGAKILDLAREHWTGDLVALEALLRFTDEELKHQELFRRVEALCAAGMPAGYGFRPRIEEAAANVLGRSNWAVLGLMLHLEVLTLAHYRSSIQPDDEASMLWKDVFFYHWREESQHAILDELEWRREDAKLHPGERDRAVDELIHLMGAIDAMARSQARADAAYFLEACGETYAAEHRDRIHEAWLRAYRWQYIVTGIREPRFVEVLRSLATGPQMDRFQAALAPIAAAA